MIKFHAVGTIVEGLLESDPVGGIMSVRQQWMGFSHCWAHRWLWMCRSPRGPGRGVVLGSSKFSYWLASQVVPLWCIACCCSVTQSCPTLFDPMVCSTPGLSVLHHLPKCAQVHVHCISDAIQPSHPLMPSSPSVLNLSQSIQFLI